MAVVRVRLNANTRVYDPEPRSLYIGEEADLSAWLAHELVDSGQAEYTEARADEEAKDQAAAEDGERSNHPAVEQATARPGEER